MKRIVYLNNKYIQFKDASVKIEDRGLQFADSIYEVIAVVNNKLIDLNFHLNRLKYSLKQIKIHYYFNKSDLKNISIKLININSFVDGFVYLQITRGVQSRDHIYVDNLSPTIIIYTKQKKFNLFSRDFKGVKVITHEDLRWARVDIKTVNLLPNILAAQKAKERNAYTAILIKNNKITEGVSSNVWMIKNKIIYTHPSNTDILNGIVRKRIKIVIKEFGLKLKENSFTLKKILSSDESFLTSSTSFVTPIIKINNNKINKGKIGNITLKLANLYSKSFLNE